MHIVFVPRGAEVRPFRGGAVRKGSMASLATGAASPVIALIGVGFRREQGAPRQHREREEVEKYDACHSIACPEPFAHVSPFPDTLFAGMNFDNVTLTSSLLFVVICGDTTQELDITIQSQIFHLRCAEW